MVDAKVGDKVIRWLAGEIRMPMIIVKVTEDLIECRVNLDGEDVIACEALGTWTFDRFTGAEVDDYLNWGPPPLATGSFITKGESNERRTTTEN
jgi:hypothetical protein